MSEEVSGLLSNFDFSKLKSSDNIIGSNYDSPITALNPTENNDFRLKLDGDWLNPTNQTERNLREMIDNSLSDPNYVYDELFKDKYSANRAQARKDAVKAQYRVDSYPMTSYSAVAKGVTKSASDMQLSDPVTLINKTLGEIDKNQLSIYLDRVVNKRMPANEHERNDFYNDEYKRLVNTIYNRVADDYSDNYKPESDIEYILGSAMKDNLFSKISSVMGRGVSGSSTFNDAALDTAYGKYSENEAGIMDNVAAGLATVAVDAPAFIGSMGIGSLAHNGTLRNLGRFLVSKNIGTSALKRIPTAYFEKIGEYAINSSVLSRGVAEGVRGAATLGSYEAGHEIANQFKYNQFDPKQIGKKALKGSLVGGAIGGLNGLYGSKSFLNPKTFEKTSLLEKSINKSVESSIFFMGDAIEQGEDFSRADIQDFDKERLTNLSQMWLKAAGTVGALTFLRAMPRLIKQRYNAYAKDLRFTPEEMALIRNEGFVKGDNSLINRIIALDYSNPIPEKYKGATNSEFKVATDKQLGDGKVKGDNDGFEQFAEENSEMLASEYNNFIHNSNIPISARAKMIYIVEGKTVEPPAISSSKLNKEVDSESGKERWMVDAIALDGSVIERIPFKNKDKAIAKDLENTHQGQINTQKILRREIARLEYNNVLKDAYNKAIKSNLFSGTFQEFVDRDKFLFNYKIDEQEPNDGLEGERAIFVDLMSDRYNEFLDGLGKIPSEVREHYNILNLDEFLAKPIAARSKRENEIADYYMSELKKEYLRLNTPVNNSIVEGVPDVPMPEITDPVMDSRPTRYNKLTNRETLHTPESYEIIKSDEFKEWYGDWEVANKKVHNRLFYKPKSSKLRYFMPTKSEELIMSKNYYAPIRNWEQRIMIDIDMGKILENNPHQKGVRAVDMKVAIDNLDWLMKSAKWVRYDNDTNNAIYYNIGLIGKTQYSIKFDVNNREDGTQALEKMELYEFGENDLGLFYKFPSKSYVRTYYGAGYREDDPIPEILLEMGFGTLSPILHISEIVPRCNEEDYKAVHAVYGYSYNGEPEPIFVKYFLEGRESLLNDPDNTLYYNNKSKFLKKRYEIYEDMKQEYIRQIYAEKSKKLLEEKRNKAKLIDSDSEDGANLPVKK
ncbi:MAG: hypothetical protein R3Y22_08750 [Bacteroidales bacterium]